MGSFHTCGLNWRMSPLFLDDAIFSPSPLLREENFLSTLAQRSPHEIRHANSIIQPSVTMHTSLIKISNWWAADHERPSAAMGNGRKKENSCMKCVKVWANTPTRAEIWRMPICAWKLCGSSICVRIRLGKCAWSWTRDRELDETRSPGVEVSQVRGGEGETSKRRG